MHHLMRPRWIAGHLLVVVALIVFVSLGFWQLRRLDEKQAFNVAVAAGLEAPSVGIGSARSEPYVRVTATGEYDVGAEVLVLRSRNGVSGHHVLTPLDLGGGRGVLVDRGWVPITLDRPGDPQAGPPAGEVTVEGVLWPAQFGGVPDEPAAVVPRIDPALVAGSVSFELDPGRYLVLLGQDPEGGELPIAEEPPPLSVGPHLGYAVQWFLFAGVVLVGYPILLRRRLEG
ncbi:MAG TPA: SURF1 family protein [Acidimicrobiia bacterium]|nr:SURF1 family protein [Acidimicrobiia bacterium]